MHPLLLDLKRADAAAADLPSAVDVLVVGAGAAGMAAALGAALEGASVLLVERSAQVGGTSAWSGGTTWVPLTAQGLGANPDDDEAAVHRYLDAAIGERGSRALRSAFVAAGPGVIAHLERHTRLRWRPYARHPDYLSNLPGATLHGRALEPLPFDGRTLGPLFALLRAPIPEFTVLGGMMVDRTDIQHLLNMGRSWRSLRHAARLLARQASDRLRHPRGTRLVMGNALAGRMLASLADLAGSGAGSASRPDGSPAAGVRLLLNAELTALGEVRADGCRRVTLRQGEATHALTVVGGVVLAAGGFNRHPQRRAQQLPGIDLGCCAGAPGHTGQAQDLALNAGAQFDDGGLSPAFWAPVSRRARPDGSTAVFPHFLMDRAKPGFVAVNAAGQRFVDESTSYHLFGLAMQTAPAGQRNHPAWLVCDADALRRYGIGLVRPGGRGLSPFLADGYLRRGATVAELAAAIGVPEGALAATLAAMNAAAAQGRDPDFHRGETDYSRHMGDATRGLRNPNLGPLGPGPFYAVRLHPGDIGASAGLRTDAQARVLGANGQPLDGLWAAGNEAASIMAGVYTGPGITLGPGIVFGTLAGQAAAARAGLARAPGPPGPPGLATAPHTAPYTAPPVAPDSHPPCDPDKPQSAPDRHEHRTHPQRRHPRHRHHRRPDRAGEVAVRRHPGADRPRRERGRRAAARGARRSGGGGSRREGGTQLRRPDRHRAAQAGRLHPVFIGHRSRPLSAGRQRDAPRRRRRLAWRPCRRSGLSRRPAPRGLRA